MRRGDSRQLLLDMENKLTQVGARCCWDLCVRVGAASSGWWSLVGVTHAVVLAEPAAAAGGMQARAAAGADEDEQHDLAVAIAKLNTATGVLNTEKRCVGQPLQSTHARMRSSPPAHSDPV